MAESTSLLRKRVGNCSVGSNPTLSAILIVAQMMSDSPFGLVTAIFELRSKILCFRISNFRNSNEPGAKRPEARTRIYEESMNTDIRWKQRLQNFGQALGSLTAAVELSKSRPLSELEKQGLIQSFEFTHELAWNLLKDYFEYQEIGRASCRERV